MDQIQTMMAICQTSFYDRLEDYLNFIQYNDEQINDLASAILEHPSLTKILDDAIFSYCSNSDD